MKPSHGIFLMKTSSLFAFLLALLLAPRPAPAAEAGAAPAVVTKEADLMVIILKPEAEQRLRLKVVPLERRAVPATRLLAGEVVTPLAADGARLAPVLGGTLDETLRMADQQAVADGRLRQAQVQVDAAKLALERAQKMRQAEAGSARVEDEARAALALAATALTTAQAQRELLGAPVTGTGAVQRCWVRVAIYSGEAARLDAQAAVTIRTLTGGDAGQSAKPVAGPPTANAQTATVDWYFELPAGAGWRVGERVAVEIPLRDSVAERLVVPASAVLHDIHGGQWVYEQTAAHTYTRRRIQVERLAGDLAVLGSGPAAGSKLVTDGAAELFGTEFMTGK